MQEVYLFKSILKYFIREQFRPSILGVFINPFYFIRRNLYTNIKKLSGFISGKTLDVGCGQKPYESLFKSSEYIGMDIEVSGHDHATSKVDLFYDGKVFPVKDNEFDSIVCNEVLEHVFNPDDFVSEINRVLKLNGYLLITVPFIWDEHEQPYDYARYSSFGLKFLLEKQGFHIEKSIKSCNDLSVIFQLLNAYIYKKIVKRRNIILFLLSLLLIIPFNIIGILFSKIFPKNNDLYLNNIILAKKINNKG